MQTKTWDYKELVDTFTPEATLGDVIQRLSAEVSKTGSVVYDVQIDGQACVDHPEVLNGTLTNSSFTQLKMKYSTLAQLFEETVVSVASQIQKILEYSPAVASHLRGPDPSAALQEFGHLIVSCQQTTEMVAELKAALVRLPSGRSRVSLWNSAEQQVSAVLKALLDTFEVRDLILTADLLEYELVSALESWREALEHEVKRCEPVAISGGADETDPAGASTAG